MNTAQILEEVEAEISRLQNVVALLRGGSAGSAAKASGKGKRTMSAAARKRISDAQKARWAKQKKATK